MGKEENNWNNQDDNRKRRISKFFFNAIRNQDRQLYDNIIIKTNKNFYDGSDYIFDNLDKIKSLLETDNDTSAWLVSVIEYNDRTTILNGMLKIEMQSALVPEDEQVYKESKVIEFRAEQEYREKTKTSYVFVGEKEQKRVRDTKTGRFIKYKE